MIEIDSKEIIIEIVQGDEVLQPLLSENNIVEIALQGSRGIQGETGLQGEQGIQGVQGEAGIGLGNTFEAFSKNLQDYPYNLNYNGGVLTSIVYDLGGGNEITKTLNYTSGVLTSVVLSGDTPSGIDLTKTLSYTGSDLTGVAYS